MNKKLRSFRHSRVIGTSLLVVAIALISCSDGMQVAQKIDSVIKANEIATLTVSVESSDGEKRLNTIQINELIIEDQFLKVGSEYINLARVKSLRVDGTELLLDM